MGEQGKMVVIQGNNDKYTILAQDLVQRYKIPFKFEYKETEDGPEVYVHNRYIGGYADLIKEIENTIGGYGDSGF
mgnify:FL=1